MRSLTKPAAIDIDRLSVTFQSPQSGARDLVVADFSLSIEQGEFVGLIGPSGCGKTTLINVVAGFVPAAGGAVRIGGADVAGIQSREVAMMFARDTLLPWRTARENVELALELRRDVQQPERAQDLLRLVGLGDYGNFYPSQLSQGMRQRVALARTLAADRGVMLMDEPFAALDAQTKSLMHAEFVRIWEANRKTVILVTHDLMEAITLSDRVVVMSPRPGRMKSEHRIDLPHPRSVMDLPSDPAFLQIYRRLWRELREELPVPTVASA